MNLIAIDIETIRLGHPLPFALRNEHGVLLAQKGYVISQRDEITYWTSRGMTLCVDVDANEQTHRAYVGKLHEMVRSDKALNDIVNVHIASDDLTPAQARDRNEGPDWAALQMKANALLRDPESENFLARLDKLYIELHDLVRYHPDATLFALIHLASTEMRVYSATHSMLVYVVCSLAASEVLNWSPKLDASLGKAALTMNISMTALQDQLAQQSKSLTVSQIEAVEQHAMRSFNMLLAMGVQDEDWLLAVRHHHDRGPGGLASKTEAMRIARLIQRADMFTARLSPRLGRVCLPPPMAMQACYFDEDKKVDEAGAALIKAVGIYTPGTLVRLATNEIAAVIRRGLNTTMPQVAVLINREGMPTGEWMIRDTSLPRYKIVGHVANKDVKVQIKLEQMLALI